MIAKNSFVKVLQVAFRDASLLCFHQLYIKFLPNRYFVPLFDAKILFCRQENSVLFSI